jgi:hypothetical protein
MQVIDGVTSAQWNRDTTAELAFRQTVADSCQCGIDHTHVRIATVTDVTNKVVEQHSAEPHSMLRSIQEAKPAMVSSAPATASVVVYYTINEPKSGQDPKKLFEDAATSVNRAITQGSFSLNMLDNIDKTSSEAQDSRVSLDSSQLVSCSLFPYVPQSRSPMLEDAGLTTNDVETLSHERRRLDASVTIGVSVGVICFIIILLVVICVAHFYCPIYGRGVGYSGGYGGAVVGGPAVAGPAYGVGGPVVAGPGYGYGGAVVGGPVVAGPAMAGPGYGYGGQGRTIVIT